MNEDEWKTATKKKHSQGTKVNIRIKNRGDLPTEPTRDNSLLTQNKNGSNNEFENKSKQKITSKKPNLTEPSLPLPSHSQSQSHSSSSSVLPQKSSKLTQQQQQQQQQSSFNKKKKPTANVELFDLIEAQLTRPKNKLISSTPTGAASNSTHHQSNGGGGLTHEAKKSTMIEKIKIMKLNDDQQGKEFVVVKKKQKKKLSTIKKRILLERLRRHVKTLQSEEGQVVGSGSDGGEVLDNENIDTRTIVIIDYISNNTLDECDSEEILEMLENAKELLQPFGNVSNFQLFHLDPPEIRAVYSSSLEASIAVGTLNGLVLGGESIQVSLLSSGNSNSNSMKLQTTETSQINLSTSSTTQVSAIVTLYNAVQFDEVQDEDEAQESLRDIKYLCQPYGVPNNISFQIHHESSDFYIRHEAPSDQYFEVSEISSMNDSFITHPIPLVEETNEEINFPVAFVKCSNFHQGFVQSEISHGKIIGGNEIQVSFFDYWCHEHAKYLPENMISLQDLNERPCGLRLTFSKNSNIISENLTTTIQQYVMQQSFNESNSSKSNELLKLAEAFSSLHYFVPINQQPSLSCSREIILQGFTVMEYVALLNFVEQSCCDRHSIPPIWISEAISIDLVINLSSSTTSTTSSSVDSCSRFLTVCHGYPINDEGGKLIQFCQDSVLVVGGFISSEDLEDMMGTEEMIAIKRDLFSLLQVSENHSINQFYCRSSLIITSPQDVNNMPYQYDENSPIVALRMEFSNIQVAEDVMYALNGMLLGGQTLISEMLLVPSCDHISSSEKDSSNISILDNNCTSNKNTILPTSEEKVNINSIDKSTIPKLAKHQAPTQAIPHASDEINAVVKEFLTTLSSLQHRAKERDPLNAKKKERFVMGLKQCLNTVKSGRAKFLLLAPDTEESDVLDDKISLLIEEAQNREIPIMYSLKRRHLGKAAASSMKQSVISICNPEGANEEYKILLKYVEENSVVV